MSVSKVFSCLLLIGLCSAGVHYHKEITGWYQRLTAINEKPKLKTEQVIESYTHNYDCRPAAEGVVKSIKAREIYRWKDGNGKIHFSDRAHNTSNPVEVVEQKLSRRDYFDLNLHHQGSTTYPGLESDLNIHISKVYDIMSGLLPREKLQKVSVNLWTFNKDSDYQTFREQHAPTASARSLGFHTSRENIAASLNRDGKHQLLTTSLHEAVHVMNSGLFGFTERWLNEGLAEYFERIKVYGQTGQVQYSKSSLEDIKNASTHFSFDQLTRTGIDDWQGEHRNLIYSYSWAWVYFLMSQNDTRDVLTSYLSKNAEQPCNNLVSASYFNKRVAGGNQELQRRFDKWLPVAETSQYF